jgi:outer membrane protein insertion porin family
MYVLKLKLKVYKSIMFFNTFKIFSSIIFSYFLMINLTSAESVKDILIKGNDRVSNETIQMFSGVNLDDDLNPNDLNLILKKLYDSGFFDEISINLSNNSLVIDIKENPIIQNMTFEGVKSKKLNEKIKENLNLRSRSSFNKILLEKDKFKIISNLKDFGYYYSNVEIYLENLENNKVNIKYNIDLGDKVKIKKVTFLGDKIFKNRKLKSIIVSEEYKFWKFISGKKYLNESIVSLDKRLLKNFYLNKGYYDIKINTSFAKLVNNEEFELIYNINAGKKYILNDLSLELPSDFNDNNFKDLVAFLKNLKGEPYSIKLVKKILEEIDIVILSDEFETISSSVVENLEDNKINLVFKIEETKKIFVERINIYGNNITRENVIRNQFEIDEGDPFNEILTTKTVNNLKSLNFFKNVNYKVIDGSSEDSKIINITVDEKPTGEISAGAGIGTSGGTVSFGVKENNYLGKGLTLLSNITVNEESLKGLFSIRNPNFNNSDKSVYFSAEATETDRLTAFGYKTNKTGFSFGTDFEYLEDFNVGVANSNYYEKIDTDSTASVRQKSQKGNYWDSFINFNFDYDKRNQKFQPTDGFRSTYYLDVPIVSETSSLSNTYSYKNYNELYEDNVSSFSLYLKSTNSITNKDIKLSERIFLPSNRLRGFESGKVGPKDGNDYIGGNFAAALTVSSTVPKILENSENADLLIFLDAGNVWGVDYDSSLNDGDEIRSAIGIGLNLLTPIGPLSFTLAEPISKSDSDITESFRFNLGTTF